MIIKFVNLIIINNYNLLIHLIIKFTYLSNTKV